MKLLALLTMLSATSALAGDFNLNIEGKTFTCTEGGTGGAGCICKRVTENNDLIAVYVGDIKVSENWRASLDGVRACKSWIKQMPSTCE